MQMIPFKKEDYPNAHAMVRELADNGTINLTAFLRPHRLSMDAIRNLDEGVLSRRDFVWLMRAREDEFRRDDYNAARRAEWAQS